MRCFELCCTRMIDVITSILFIFALFMIIALVMIAIASIVDAEHKE
jgi:hypothetical protein